jgi:hypothetical protein
MEWSIAAARGDKCPLGFGTLKSEAEGWGDSELRAGPFLRSSISELPRGLPSCAIVAILLSYAYDTFGLNDFSLNDLLLIFLIPKAYVIFAPSGVAPP